MDMKKSIILVVILIAIMLTSVLSGCSKSADVIKLGVYDANEGFAILRIDEDKTFVLFRDAFSSYAPMGSYTIDGDKLLLNVDDELETGIIEFKIDDEMLIFESGEIIESQIKKGTEFVYRNEE
jgi:hypothetical protein